MANSANLINNKNEISELNINLTYLQYYRKSAFPLKNLIIGTTYLIKKKSVIMAK